MSPPVERRSWTVTGPLWRWRDGSWHFLTLPEDASDEIADLAEGRAGGFGAVKVEVTCGPRTWERSLFPITEHSCYVLPVKAAVRRAEGLAEGRSATVTVTHLTR